MWERLGLGIKLAVAIVAIGFMVSGRPPAIAQDERMIPADPTIGVLSTTTQLEQRDITVLKERLAIDEATIKTQDARIWTNSSDINVLNTKWLCAMGVLAFLQSSGALVAFLKKKSGA